MKSTADEQRVIRPQPGAQTTFLESNADICIYAGSAGSGKSYALLLEALRHVDNPGHRAIIFRRTFPELRSSGGLWDASCQIYPALGAKGSRYRLEWEFPSGAQIMMRPLENPEDRFSYQGSQWSYLAMDELGSFDEESFWFLQSRLRSTAGIRPYFRAASNPAPFSWLSELIAWWIGEDGFLIPERSGKARWFIRLDNEMIWGDSRGELIAKHGPRVQPRSLAVVSAKLSDNKILTQADPAYESTLMALPYVERMRLLEGSWAVRANSGSVFNRSWFEIISAAEVPSEGTTVRYWDRAGTVPGKGKADPDWTVGVKMMKTRSREYIILDVVRDRRTPAGVEQLIRETMLKDGPRVTQWLEQDPGSAGQAEVSHLTRALAEVGAGCSPGDDFLPSRFTVRTRRPQGSKVERANPFSAMAEQGHVRLVRAPWNEAFLRELHGFPDGAHDDQVDASSGAFTVLSTSKVILCV